MTAARPKAHPMLVLDMSTLRFQRSFDSRSCALMTSRGEIVTVVDCVPDEDANSLAFRTMDAALDRGSVLRAKDGDPQQFSVGLYNPFTQEVAVGAVPETVPFACEQPVAVPADGLECEVIRSSKPLYLNLDGQYLEPRQLSFAGLTRIGIAHQAA